MQNLGLGISPDANFKSQTVPFRSNDLFCFITDGLSEALNAKNEQFGMERVTACIRNGVQRSAVELNEHLVSSVKQFSLEKEVADDITCVVVRII